MSPSYRSFQTILFGLLSVLLLVLPARAQLTVGAPQTISETRVGRTIFEYVMSASVTNGGTTIAKGVTAACTSTSPRTTVVQGTLTIGNVAAQASASSVDTFTIAHDRTVPFDPAVLQWTITKVPGAPTVTLPASPTNAASSTVTGTAEPGVTVEITGGTSTVTGTTSGTGAYSVAVPLQQNKVNKLFVTALNPAGRSEPVPADIIHDAVAPSLFIDFPTDGAQLTNDTVIVAGRVGDMLSGFMGLGVKVNNQPANVAVGLGQNGSFERGGVPLVLGANTLTATATDVNGNAITKTITVTRVAITGPRMTVVSGDAQIAHVHEKLAQPILIRITNADGSPFAGKVVTFNVTRSDGRVSATGLFGDPSGLMLQQTTDANGYAAAYWTLGGDAGCGNNRVSVTSKDIAGTIFFCASAMPSPPRQLNVGSGNNQRAEAGGLAPEPLRAWVSDSCNGGANVPVTFTVTGGGGKVNGLDTVTVNTVTTGHASVQFTLGPDAGANTIEANFTGNTGSPATFTVYGLVRDPAKPTTFTGLVLDNTSQPIGGAFCGLTVGGSFFTATTDLQGRFTLGSATTPLPAGKADFYVNGTTATSLGGVAIPVGSFPSLSYTPTIVPNAENSLTSPVLLPHLNPANARTWDGTTDLVLTCQGIAGLKMTIKAGSMRKVDGTLVSPTNTAVVSLNQVHADNVPMPIPDGASPPFTWTLQPARATFDPPIQIEYPNMSGLPAGSIAYFLTFNHDTEKFEIFASGHVTNDGSTILSDPGAGLTVSGWGCNCPPYSVTGKCSKPPNRIALSQIDRIPIYGGPNPIEGQISVLFDPSLLTNGEQIQLAILNNGGAGDAVFWNGSAETHRLVVTSPTTITLHGKVNSSVRDNLSVVAYIGTQPESVERFSVRTWVVKNSYQPSRQFTTEGDGSTDGNSGALCTFTFTSRTYITAWAYESESGDIKDLTGTFVAERLTYRDDPIFPLIGGQCNSIAKPGAAEPFAADTQPKPPADIKKGLLLDTHRSYYLEPFPDHFVNNTNIVIQSFDFLDPVWSGPNNTTFSLTAPLQITRLIFQNLPNGKWFYEISETGFERPTALELTRQ